MFNLFRKKPPPRVVVTIERDELEIPAYLRRAANLDVPAWKRRTPDEEAQVYAARAEAKRRLTRNAGILTAGRH